MVLLGTAILGITVCHPAGWSDSSGAPAVWPTAATMRIKLRDTVEGFRLSGVSEKELFCQGTSTVEVP
jgi:hypothetical protein